MYLHLGSLYVTRLFLLNPFLMYVSCYNQCLLRLTLGFLSIFSKTFLNPILHLVSHSFRLLQQSIGICYKTITNIYPISVFKNSIRTPLQKHVLVFFLTKHFYIFAMVPLFLKKNLLFNLLL